MNKTSPLGKNLHLDEDWLNHPAIEWLSSHKKMILSIFLGLLFLLILAYRFTAIRTLNAEKDFFQAETIFNRLQQTKAFSQDPSSTSELEQLIGIMQRYPELKAKYEGPLAQTLLINGLFSPAQQFADDIFKRTQSNHLQPYQSFSQITFLIDEGQYSDALQQSIQLKSTLDQLGEQIHPLLSTFNLIRLAILYQKTGQQEEERQAWEQLENQPESLKKTLATNQLFKSGQVSLENYIEERKKALLLEKNELPKIHKK